MNPPHCQKSSGQMAQVALEWWDHPCSVEVAGTSVHPYPMESDYQRDPGKRRFWEEDVTVAVVLLVPVLLLVLRLPAGGELGQQVEQR